MNGKKIQFLTKDEWRTGEIVTAEGPEADKFGMRIDTVVAIDDHGPLQKTFHVMTWNLTEAQIRAVKSRTDPNLPFEVVLG